MGELAQFDLNNSFKTKNHCLKVKPELVTNEMSWVLAGTLPFGKECQEISHLAQSGVVWRPDGISTCAEKLDGCTRMLKELDGCIKE